MNKNQIEKLLEQHFNIYGDITFNSNGTVDVDGDVELKTQVQQLPVKFGEVTGIFDCSTNQLTTLINAPHSVGIFYCLDNKLSSLEGGPQIATEYRCTINNITSLSGMPHTVTKSFACSYRKDLPLLKLIVNDIHSVRLGLAPHDVDCIIYKYVLKANFQNEKQQRNALAVKCAAELIQAGYRNNARL